ncbi:MAG: NHLP leader peptide family natural product precursor [Firmicutes bacterium]|jgi:hypothetical protein|nr:NHLP leader peptide family natural product precursor [Bacillota bacterium]
MSENFFAKRREVEAQVASKASQDESFRKRLLADPRAALGDFGVRVPEDVEIKVLEESARLSYLVLPRNPEELSAEDLDAVAGGLGASVQCTCNLVKPM